MRLLKKYSFVSPMYKSAFIFLAALCLYNQSVAQDTLPRITVNQISDKVLISWTNPYTSVTNIGIQRSYDSLKHFKTIGSVLDVKAQTNGFVDSKAFMPAQYYRLFISFEGGSYIFTKSYLPGKDTLQAIPQIVENYKPVETWFIPSRHVYTGRDNNVIISLPDYSEKRYSLKFFEDDNTFLFEIRKVTHPYLTLDKVNFTHAGLFRFELFENGVITERHKVYIPRDGRPVPPLDEHGYELK